MKKSLLISLITVLLLTFSFTYQSSLVKNNDFGNFIKNIPVIDLPFITTCQSFGITQKIDVDTNLSKKYNPDSLEIVGIIKNEKRFICILYAGAADYLVPVLITYTKEGVRISKEDFMNDYCGQTFELYYNQYLSIDKNLKIMEVDTTLVFKLDTVNFTIIDTLKKEIRFSKFEVDNNGKIIKRN